MLNTGKLAGRVVFITGASRGIGKEIALKVARDGARVVVAAKTAEPHPTLPGTIYTAAKEIEAAGGEALPCVVDVRDETSVAAAVQQTVTQFGGIDVLVNNASAISLTGTLTTHMKKFDLMHNINTRGTYLVSKCCLPYLKRGVNPHVLNISPPLNMNARWFRNHVAYTMAKYGMSMCVLGMAEEFRADGIAVNALWPKTAIYTAAMRMLAGDSVAARCRQPAIMADAAYVMLTRDSRSYSGHFAIDEDVLRDVGVTDCHVYAVDAAAAAAAGGLLPDFFLDDETDADTQRISVKPGGSVKYRQPAAAATTSSSASQDKQGDDAGKIGAIFEAISGFLDEDLVKKTNAVYQFNVTGDASGQWFLDLRNGTGSCGQGAPPLGQPDCTFTMHDQHFQQMFAGELKATSAFMSGKMKLSGDMAKAMKLEKLMAKLKSKL